MCDGVKDGKDKNIPNFKTPPTFSVLINLFNL